MTARQGGAKVMAYTDENGRYSLDLTPGVWDIEITMLGFNTLHGQVTMGLGPNNTDWTMDLPRYGAPAAAASKPAAATASATAPAKPASSPSTTTASNSTQQGRGNSGGRGGYGRGRGNYSQQARGRGANGQQQQEPGFQSVNVTATSEGEQALAAAGADPMADAAAGGESADLMVNGSVSGGLQQSADDQMRLNRMAARGGGPGGFGGPGGIMGGPSLGDVGFMIPGGSDGLGMGGFGAAGANAGFGTDNGGGFGPGGGGGGGRGGGGGGGGRGGGGGGGGGRGGRGGGGFNGRGGRGRGPFNGQFAAFGNRRRVQPAYSGSVALTLSNSALNAAPFSLNGQTVAKPPAARENLAMNIGGPVRIPHLVSNDKWFVYLTVQGARGRTGRDIVSSVPTAAERGGDFSLATVRNVPVTIYDPLSDTPFPNDAIPVNRFNPAAVGLLKYIPLPMYGDLVQNYQIAPSTPSSTNAVGVRLNGSVTNKDRLAFNEQYSNNNSISEQTFGYRDTTNGYGLSAGAGWTHSFKPRFNNAANLAFSRSISKASPYFAYGQNIAGELGIAGPDEEPIDYGPPNLSFTNFGSLSDSSASLNRNQTTNFTDTITYVIRRKHNVTAGFGYRRMQQNALSFANSRGSFAFSGLLTSGLDANGNPLPNTGFDFADFLLGFPQSSSLRIGNSNNYFRGWATSAYAADDWRVSPGLTLNLGLRYEYFSPYTELYGHLANLDVNPALTAVAIVTPGEIGPYSGKYPASLINGDPNNFSPRLGFAWRPSQKHNRVIRGGYSIFYSGANYGGMAARMAAQPPFATTASLTTSVTDPLTLENGFPTAPSNTVTNTYAINKDYKLAYAQTWSLAVQQTLPHNVLMEVEYIGTKGTGLDVQYQPNRTLTTSVGAAQELRIANANQFTYETSVGNSIFHAGQVRMTRRFTRGMSAVLLYTFSKSIDDAFNNSLVQNPLDLSAERALSTFDQRHRLSLTYTLSSPVGIHGLWRNGGVKTRLFTGWTLNGNFTANSGTPRTAYVSGNLSNIGGTAALGNSRAEATGLPIDAGGDSYFNLLAFTTPPDGQYGNAGRDTIPGPFLISLNSSLNRAWRFGDSRKQLQLRLNAGNVLNHVQITGFGTTVNSTTYGLPTSASGTRTVTLLLRFNF